MLQIVVNALMMAIPSIMNVLLVCLLFWLIFSIVGVQFFKGRFFKCVDGEGEKVDKTLIPDRAACEANSSLEWKNSDINFDNVASGFLALFQVV